MYRSGKDCCIDVSKMNVKLIEPEYGFLLGKDIKPDASTDDIVDAIYKVVPAIEIVHSSFDDWKKASVGQLIADLACNGCWIYNEHSDPLTQEQKAKIKDLKYLAFHSNYLHVQKTGNLTWEDIISNRSKPAQQGIGLRVGDPFDVLVWLVKELSKDNNHLKKGEFVTTGITVDPPYTTADEGKKIIVDFKEFGYIEARFSGDKF